MSIKKRRKVMKRLLLTMTVMVLFLSGAVFADQILYKFETDTDGFNPNTWAQGVTGTASVADPDAGQSDKALSVSFDGAVGQNGFVHKQDGNIGLGNALVLVYWVYLPANVPDSVQIKLYGQDATNWNHTEAIYDARDIPKEVWYPLNFNIEELVIDTSNKFIGGSLGCTGVEITTWNEHDDDATWAGTIYIDDVSLIGAFPTVVGDFEDGVGSFLNTGWGGGYVDMASVADPASGQTDKALRIGYNGDNGSARIYWENGITPAATDLIMFAYVYLPTGTPDTLMVQFISQDNGWGNEQKMGVRAGAIPKDTWWPIQFNYAALVADASKGFDAGTLQWVGIEIDVWSETDADTAWAGNVYVDDLMLLGTNEELPSLVASTLTVVAKDSTDLQGKIHYYNYITFTEQPEHTQATYNVYFAESDITNVDATGVHHLQSLGASGKSSTSFAHELFSADGTGTLTYHYAVVVNEADSSKFDQTASTGSATNNCTDAPDIPLLTSFNFVADGDLSEFYAVAEDFPGMVFRPESQGGSDETTFVYTTGNSTFDFEGYCVMTSEAMYWGFSVTDATYGNSQLWRGDGVDPFFGLYDINAKEDILTSTNYGEGWMRFGIAARADDKIQWDGYDTAFDLPGIQSYYVTPVFGSTNYIVEWSFKFDSLAQYTFNDAQGPDFTPADGMFIPFKIDVNDNDTTFDAAQGSEHRAHQLSHGATFFAEGWPNPFGWAGRAVITSTSKWGIEQMAAVASKFELAKAYPNPFNPSTNIAFKVAQPENVSLVIYNVLGQEVKTLTNTRMEPGQYNLIWNGTDMFGKPVGSGIYFCRMQAGDFVKIQKMTLMK
jgi:hypothetical protein